jgi:pilus assembly protein CpaB
MKPKTLILLVVAVGCGLVASYMTSRLLAERNAPPPKIEDAETVLVAKTRVPSHQRLKEPEKYFEEREVPAGVAPKGALKSLDAIKDKMVSRPLGEGSYVTPEDVVTAANFGLAANLPPGMRAVAIRVNAESVAGGFVLPQSRVDVISTVKAGEGSITRTILQDMLVLAVDMKSGRNQDDPNAMVAQTVTLAARPEEVERIRVAGGVGELSLSLRPIGDNSRLPLRGSKALDLTRPISVADEERVDAGAQQGGPSVGLPSLPAPDKGPVVQPDKGPVVQPDKGPVVVEDGKAEPEKEKVKFVQSIRNGPYLSKHVYIQSGEEWLGGDRPRNDEERSPSAPKQVDKQPEKLPEENPQPEVKPDPAKRGLRPRG